MKNLLALTFTVACIWAQAQESQTRTIGPFTGVKAEEGIDVFLKKGTKESVRVEVSGTSLQNVITEVSGSYLKVHMRSGDYNASVNAKVFVTYVKIDKLSASSAGSIFSDGTIDVDALELSATSAGNVDITVNAGTVEVTASSAGEMELQGSAKTLIANVSSAGEIDARDLTAKKVEAEASSAGSIRVSVTEELDAHASSGGSIRYRGNPNKSVTNSTSGGSVKKSD